MPPVRSLVCFDLPCLISLDDALPSQALSRALRRLGLDDHAPAAATPLRWPGVEARGLLGATFGSGVWADAAAAAYDDAFAGVLARTGARLSCGAAAAVSACRAAGHVVCLTSEFSAATREALLDVLEWDVVAMTVSADDTASGLPGDAFAQALRRSGCSPEDLTVVTGSVSAVQEGRALDAGAVIGVLGESYDRAHALAAAGATELRSLRGLAEQWRVAGVPVGVG